MSTHHEGPTDPAEVIATTLFGVVTQRAGVAALIVRELKAAGFGFVRSQTRAECDADQGVVLLADEEAVTVEPEDLTPEELAFVAEYRALCEKHGFAVTYDGGYAAAEVCPLGVTALGEHFRRWNA